MNYTDMVYQKGQSGNLAGKPKGTKNRTTLDKEEAQRIFREKQSEVWEETIKKLNPHYVADRMMGKEPDKVDVNANVNVSEISEEVLQEAERLLDERLKNGQVTNK